MLFSNGEVGPHEVFGIFQRENEDLGKEPGQAARVGSGDRGGV